MKIHIMCDMEGVSGIVTWGRVGSGKPMYDEGRRLYTEEINAAVRGARRAGAEEIVVIDGHNAGGDNRYNSLLPELLHPDCEWVAHHPWTRYTELLEAGADACLMVGYHARAHTPDGVLSHTITSVKWHNLWFNGELAGEIAVNAALCGHYGCPVLLMTGDVAVCREAKALLGEGLTTVAVKKGLSRYSARQIPPLRAREMIEEGAYQALQDLDAVAPYVPASPVTITAQITKSEMVEDFRGRPGLELDYDTLKVHSRASDWKTAWDQIWHWEV